MKRDDPEYSAMRRDIWIDRVGDPTKPEEMTWRREEVIGWLRAEYVRTSRPPRYKARSRNKQEGFRVKGRRPSHATIRKIFGSMAAACEAAGVPMRKAARGSHRVCRRGHLLEGENLYVNPKGERACRTCQRILQRRHYRATYARKRVAAESQCEVCGRTYKLSHRAKKRGQRYCGLKCAGEARRRRRKVPSQA